MIVFEYALEGGFQKKLQGRTVRLPGHRLQVCPVGERQLLGVRGRQKKVSHVIASVAVGEQIDILMLDP